MADRQTTSSRLAAPARPTLNVSPRAAAARPRRRRGSGCAVFLLSLSALFLLAITAGLVGAALLYNSDMIPPGLASLGLPLGGQTRAAAAGQLQRAWQERTIVVDLNGVQRTMGPADLGVTLDISSTVGLAYAEGRSSAAMASMLAERRLEVPATNVEPIWKFDPAVADRTLQALAREVYVPPTNATITIADGRVETTKSIAGRALDVSSSGALLSKDPWGVVTAGHFSPIFVAVPPRVADLNPIAAQVAPYLTTPIAIHLYDAIANQAVNWQIPPKVIGDWINITNSAEGDKAPTWDFDADRVQSYLGEQAASLGDGRSIQIDKAVPAVLNAVKAPGTTVNLRIYHQGQQHTVQSGETFSSIADTYGVPYPWILKANPGIGESLRPGQTVQIPSLDVLLPLPPKENKRIVVSLTEQKMVAYENGAVKWQWPVSTGMASSPTAPGIFQIQTHEPNAYAGNWDLWMPYFMGVYRPVPDVDFMNGFHGFPKRGGSQILWQNDIGRRVTYGCILISNENAKQLYNWAEEGVVVEIHR
jgi:lipoprotein-anchoring transpeptidase ErfK/SrfK